MTNEEFNKQWHSAATVALSGMDYRNKIPQAITLTDVVDPEYMDAKYMQAVLTLETHIKMDRIEGPITKDGLSLGRVFPWRSEVDDEDVKDLRNALLDALLEGRVYIKHYHVTLNLPEKT
tara:strand:+ start:1353 stop:1712 length:360 start_codon:yes stop_codon:yes gene_type:complete